MTVIPFPRTRDRPFVVKQAVRMAASSIAVGENYLAYQLRRQRETMARRGIASDLIDAHLGALERAIRAELAGMFDREADGAA